MDGLENNNPEWLRERVKTMLKAGYTKTRVAIETGANALAIEHWLDGRSDTEVDAAITVWCAQIRKVARDTKPSFVMTPTARAIISALETARTVPTIAIIYGPAGIGKTEAALFHWRNAEHLGQSSIYYCMCSKSRRNVVGSLESVAEAINAYGTAYRAKQLEDAIKARLREGDLLIIDEAQHLRPDALDALSFLNDACGVGIAYMGNEKVYRDIHDPGKAGKFAQLDSRFGKRLHLMAPSEADIDALLEAWKIQGIQERKFAINMGTRDGGIRSLSRVLDIAWAIARNGEASRITIDHLCAAAEETGDMEVMS